MTITFWREILVDSFLLLKKNRKLIGKLYVLLYGFLNLTMESYMFYLSRETALSYNDFSSSLGNLVETNLPIIAMLLILKILFVIFEIAITYFVLGNGKNNFKELLSKTRFFIVSQFLLFLIIIGIKLALRNGIIITIILSIGSILLFFLMPYSIDLNLGFRDARNQNIKLFNKNILNIVIYSLIYASVGVFMRIGSEIILGYRASIYNYIAFLGIKNINFTVGIIVQGLINLALWGFLSSYFSILSVKFYQKAKEQYDLQNIKKDIITGN